MSLEPFVKRLAMESGKTESVKLLHTKAQRHKGMANPVVLAHLP